MLQIQRGRLLAERVGQADADPDNPNPRIWLGESIRYLGKALLAGGKVSEGRAPLLEAAEILETIVVRNAGDVSARIVLAETYVNLAESYTAPGDSASRSWLVKARGQFWDLRREGKLSPSVPKLLAEVEDGIAKGNEQSGER